MKMPKRNNENEELAKELVKAMKEMIRRGAARVTDASVKVAGPRD